MITVERLVPTGVLRLQPDPTLVPGFMVEAVAKSIAVEGRDASMGVEARLQSTNRRGGKAPSGYGSHGTTVLPMSILLDYLQPHVSSVTFDLDIHIEEA